MAVVVSLLGIVFGIEMQSDEHAAYLDPATGTVVTISEEEHC